MRGSVTQLVRKQGYGFILGEDGCEVYFEGSALRGSDFARLRVGQWVEYEIQFGAERLRATNVSLLAEGPNAAGNVIGGVHGPEHS